MRLWTYLLPAGLWIWLVSRKCETVTFNGCSAYNADRGVAIILYDTTK